LSSSYTNIAAVTESLASKIWSRIKDDKELSNIISSQEQIRFRLPNSDKEAKPQLCIFLYQALENTNMRNQPPPKNSEDPRTLVSLNLHYLIIPITEKTETDQLLLGKTLQIFAETPILRKTDLRGPLGESGEELKITLDRLSIEDLNRLWTMLQAPYRLCVSYSVSAVPIQTPGIIKIKGSKEVILKPDLPVKKSIKA
jgi:hypothetical protein